MISRISFLAIFILLLSATAGFCAPVILGQTALSADNNNWPGDSAKGAAISIYGTGFGSSGLITCCGVTLQSTDSEVVEWGAYSNPKLPKTPAGEQISRITFHTTSGMTGSGGIRITVGGESSAYAGVDSTSTTHAPFQIIDAGTIYRYPTDFTTETIEEAAEGMANGDFLYIESYGSPYYEGGGDIEIGNDYGGTYLIGHSISRRTISAYPGADVDFRDGCGFSIIGSYWTIANFTLEATDASVISYGHQDMYALNHNMEFTPAEDLTTYTASGTPGRLTVSSSQVTVTTLDNDEDAYVVGQYSGTGYWESGFSIGHYFNFTALSNEGAYIWAFTNSNRDDIGGLIDSGEDLTAAKVYEDSGSYYIRLEEYNGGVLTASSAQEISIGQWYYFTVLRDEEVLGRSGGLDDYGKLRAGVFTADSSSDVNVQNADLVGILEVDLTEKEDFTYWYAFSSNNTGSGGNTTTGYVAGVEYRNGITMGNWAYGIHGWSTTAEGSTQHFCDTQGHNNRIAFCHIDTNIGTNSSSANQYVLYLREGGSFWLAYNYITGGNCWSVHMFDEERDTEDNSRWGYDILIEGNTMIGESGSDRGSSDGVLILQARAESVKKYPLIRNNLIKNTASNMSQIVRFRHDVTNVKFVNNVIVGYGSENGFYVTDSGPSIDELSNNIFLNIGGYDIMTDYSPIFVSVDYNGYDGTPNHDSNDFTETNAQTNLSLSFTNEANHDYSQQAGSDGIDIGKTLAIAPHDANGTSRPQNSIYDIGLHEYGSGGSGESSDNDNTTEDGAGGGCLLSVITHR